METQLVAVAGLIPDPENARKHPEKNILAIKESLARHGQVLPLVVREKIVYGGNGTLEAVKRLGWENVHVIEYAGTAVEARALAIALNRTAELAEWDTERLERTLSELLDEGFEPLGFDTSDLEQMFPVRPEEFRVETPNIETESSALRQPIIQYSLIFDDEAQQKRFHAFLRRLKQQYPDEETIAARLDLFISTQEGRDEKV